MKKEEDLAIREEAKGVFARLSSGVLRLEKVRGSQDNGRKPPV